MSAIIKNKPITPDDIEKIIEKLRWKYKWNNPSSLQGLYDIIGATNDVLKSKTKKEIDYKDLLIKYIKHVEFHEGSTYLNNGYNSEYLTDKEFEIMQKINCEKI